MRSLFCTGIEECYGFGVSDGQPRVFRLAEGRWTVTDEVGRREIRAADWVVSQCPTADDCVVMFSGAPMNMRPWAEIAHIRDGRWVSTDAVNQGLPDNLWVYDLSCLSISNCFIVGGRNPTGERASVGPGIWQWTGQEWLEAEIADAPNARLYSVSCGSPQSCWAVGRGADGPILLHGVPA